MTRRRNLATRRARAAARAGCLIGLLAVAPVLAGCGTSSRTPEEPKTPMAAAIDACLRDAEKNASFPLESSKSATVTIRTDPNGWWAVEAVAGKGADAFRLTCTAVPDAKTGARASSFEVRPVG